MAGNNLLLAKILKDSNTTKGGTNALAEQFPQLYGALQGLLGTAPDEVGGSVLDGSHQAQSAGANVGFPLGLLGQMLPAAKLTKGLPVGMSIKSVDGPLSKFVYPQEQALATAQRNAALPWDQGGLNLSADNTAMQRARAMGYETGDKKTLYHATRDDVSGEIDPSKSDFGFHMGTLQQADARVKSRAPTGFTYPDGANIMPLVMDKYANMLKVADEGTFHADALAPQLAKKGMMDKQKAKDLANMLEGDWMKKMEPQWDQQMRDIVHQNDYDGLKYSNAQEGPGTSYAVSNPSVIRSRFAAFDPMRRDSPDILAGLLPLSSMADQDTRNKLAGLLNP